MGEPNKKKVKKNKHIPFRLNVLFLMVFLAFSVLIIRLGVVQIINGQTYEKQLQSTKHFTNTVQSVRGLIYDSKGVLLAGNAPSPGVMFTRNQSMTSTDLMDLAKKLSQYLPVSTQKKVTPDVISTSQVTQRDLKDYWIGTHPNAYQDKLSATEQKLDPKKAYQLLLTRITPSDLASISKSDLKIVAIWRRLAQATNLSPTLIESHLTDKELANLGEHLNSFGGSITTTVSATRTYPKGSLFYLGKVNQIPLHEVNNYLAQGVNRTDLVGVSNLEQEYNDILTGIPKTLTYTTNNGKPVGDPVVKEGRRGDDLVLTIDYKFEQKVDKIIQDQIKQCYPSDHECNTAYAVVMNPHTGGILAISGQQYNGSKFTDVSDGTVYNSFAMGSAVKPSTVLMGYQNNAIPGTLVDKPIKYPHGGSFKSMEYIGTVNTAQALEASSNVYMATVASNMAGFHFTNQGSYYSVAFSSQQRFDQTFLKMRDTYGTFGLGANTGVDLPFEATGYKGPLPTNPGIIMQFAIGQYDTYTPLQLAQYASTIANGGYRIAPHFLESVHYPSGEPNKIGATEYKVKPDVLNKIPNPPSQFKVVHNGMYLVTHGSRGTAKTLGSLNYSWTKWDIAAKTGTAEVHGKIRNNKTLIAYAPANNPQVAIAIVCPNLINRETTNLFIAGNIFDAYFKNQGK